MTNTNISDQFSDECAEYIINAKDTKHPKRVEFCKKLIRSQFKVRIMQLERIYQTKIMHTVKLEPIKNTDPQQYQVTLIEGSPIDTSFVTNELINLSKLYFAMIDNAEKFIEGTISNQMLE